MEKVMKKINRYIFHRPAVCDSLVLLLTLFLCLVSSVPPLHLALVLFLLSLFTSSLHLPCQLINHQSCLSLHPIFHPHLLISTSKFLFYFIYLFIICSLFPVVFHHASNLVNIRNVTEVFQLSFHQLGCHE